MTEKPGDSLSEGDGEEVHTDLNCCDKLKCLEINHALYAAVLIFFPLATHCSSCAHSLNIQYATHSTYSLYRIHYKCVVLVKITIAVAINVARVQV